MSSQSTATLEGPPPLAKPEREFHPNFAIKRPGDIILQADDLGDYNGEKLCFYFRRTLLNELSNFFQNLPAPSDQDLVDGVPLVPLHNVSSPGLHLFLTLIHSTTLPLPHTFHDSGNVKHNVASKAIIDAAMIGKLLDTPIIHRLIVTALEDIGTRKPILVFAVWAIGGVKGRLSEAAKATLEMDITRTEPCISAAVKEHALLAWTELLDLHLRRTTAMKRFAQYKTFSDDALLTICNKCRVKQTRNLETAKERLAECKTVDAILQEWKGPLGIDCYECWRAVRRVLVAKVKWVESFASVYSAGWDLTEARYDYEYGYIGLDEEDEEKEDDAYFP
ncbi:uncharacterized protein MKK02DRAFT_38098 [Dioszegia hungarica]|uniref:Uncharacterized protein n=1 Tax=Dioszegia hungarica TaxID=4972 RepID=A0AA38H6X2_9TREE|nr:uncharacterized protein MKK02DRAFT_38098 [Dioszegia hungarica]KAI9633444.1 hypothetical protein MKK02DRAFT_38098 [Dioszegia hungarica]